MAAKSRLRNDGPEELLSPANEATKRIDRLGYWLDSSIRIPGIGYRIGYDALIGLIPGFGDIAGMALSSYIIVEAARLGAPPAKLLRMAVNVGIESVFGAIPVLGDVFDATYKANMRNLRLLHTHIDPDGVRRVPSNRRYFMALAAALVLGLAFVGMLAYFLVRFLLDWAGVI
jgi:hypothetical protein